MPSTPNGHISAKAQSKRRRCLRRCLAVTCPAVGLVLLALGVSSTFIFGYMFREKLNTMMPIANGSLSYRGWSSPPNEITFQIWLWNVTNPQDIIRGARPVVNQVGPFTFGERRRKEDIEFYENDTVSFREYTQFFYKPELSVGNISELIITSTNMPYAVLSAKTKHTSQYARNMAGKFLKRYSGGLFVTRTAKEILLGYTDPALKSLAGSIRYFMPGVPFQTKTGLFIGTNNTHKGQFLVHTGRGNISNFNRVQLYNGLPSLQVWPSEKANRIVGTDGSMFGPGVRQGGKLDIFSIDICLSISLLYSGLGEVNGLPALQFSPSPEMMLNATLKPENRMFCSSDRCLDSGVMNMSLCRGGVPLVISSPHFTGAPTYQAAVDGVFPDPDQFGTKIFVEPNTGFVIGAQRRMQMNVALERVQGYTDTENLADDLLIMPLMWLNQSAKIDPHSAAMFKAHLLAPIQIVGYAQWALIAAGVVLISVTALVCSLLAHRQRRRRRRGPIYRGSSHQQQQQVQLQASVVCTYQPEDPLPEIQASDHLIKKLLQDESLRESAIV